MTRCEGTPQGDCRFRDTKTVKLRQGDLMLCNNCNVIRFPEIDLDLVNTNVARPKAKLNRANTVTAGELQQGNAKNGKGNNERKKKLVVNELLAFVVNKINYTMPPVMISQLCTKFYGDVEILHASQVLHDHCASGNDPRFIKRQGPKKGKQAMEDIIALCLKQDDLPVTFAAVDVTNMPPVSFDSIDVCTLLSKIEASREEVGMLKACVTSMRETMVEQQEVIKELTASVASIRDNVVAKPHVRELRAEPSAPPLELDSPPLELDSEPTRLTSTPAAAQKRGEGECESESIMRLTPTLTAPQKHGEEIEMLGYSYVVRNGKQKPQPVKPMGRQRQNSVKNKNRKEVIGKGTGLSFRAKENTRFANVFVSRLEPGLETETVKNYLDKTLNVNCKVECSRASEWYTSFHIECVCIDPSVFMNDQIWPDGAYVRWWKPDRQKGGKK